jgi:hypothetical protein
MFKNVKNNEITDLEWCLIDLPSAVPLNVFAIFNIFVDKKEKGNTLHPGHAAQNWWRRKFPVI